MALDFAATYKVLVLGDSNVGKTCIVHRYCDERYYDTYISTIGEYHPAQTTIATNRTLILGSFVSQALISNRNSSIWTACQSSCKSGTPLGRNAFER